MSKTTRQSEKVLTEEQLNILNSSGNICINAVAGSGKTTTIIEYAATRPKDAKILYLAFNKSVKLEAASRFKARGLHNVTVETAHSLAYRHVMHSHKYQVKAQGYKTHEIAELLELRQTGEKHAEYIIANHISKFITYFCNSDKGKVQDLNYLDTVYDTKAKAFVRSFYTLIENGTRQLLAKMDRGEIAITHDFYLKKFQLSNPVLPYDYILFDEGQDASAAMLDVFFKQKATKVIVGDMHQQIYSWRYAVNSLSKTDYPAFTLSTSFRFPQDIAGLAENILYWKNHLDGYKPVTINGKGAHKSGKSTATIARTNLGLLLKAIEYVTNNKKVKHIYFEGNINSYTYADDGASLYDVLNLHNLNHDRIRDALIRSMTNLDDLEEYIEKTEDVQLGMMVEIVKEYGNDIFDIIKSLKDLHTGDEEKAKAEMIFSTVHRAKGMEYDIVHLVEDFITEPRLEKMKAEHKASNQPLNFTKWNEEINLLYVAATRAKSTLHIPEALLPNEFEPGKHIVLIKNEKKNSTPNYPSDDGSFLSKRQSITKKTKPKRETAKASNQIWTADDDGFLKQMHDSGVSMSDIAEVLGRTKSSVFLRLRKLGYLSE